MNKDLIIIARLKKDREEYQERVNEIGLNIKYEEASYDEKKLWFELKAKISYIDILLMAYDKEEK